MATKRIPLFLSLALCLAPATVFAKKASVLGRVRVSTSNTFRTDRYHQSSLEARRSRAHAEALNSLNREGERLMQMTPGAKRFEIKLIHVRHGKESLDTHAISTPIQIGARVILLGDAEPDEAPRPLAP